MNRGRKAVKITLQVHASPVIGKLQQALRALAPPMREDRVAVTDIANPRKFLLETD
ncbi:MAG: hypothetical protein V2A56_12800 [bacterium]